MAEQAGHLILNVQLVEYPRSYDSLYIEDIYEVIESVMHLSPSTHVGVIQKGVGHAPKNYNVGIKSDEIWRTHQLDKFLEERYDLESGKTVLIQKAYEEYEDVTVKNVPPYWGQVRVERILSYYGIIVSMSKESLRFSERNSVRYGYAGIWNGNWRVRMKVKVPIPSTLIISDVKIELHYRDQRKTCWRCGMDHQKRDCTTRYSNFVNKFDISDFPVLNKHNRAQNSGEEHTEENVNSDTEMDQTEVNNAGENTQTENHTEENNGENHTGESHQSENHTGENNKVDFNAIVPAPIAGDNQGSIFVPNLVSVEQNVINNSDNYNNNDFSQEQVSGTMTVEAQVIHAENSQVVTRIPDSPMHTEEADGSATATASETEAVEQKQDAEETVESSATSMVESGITPGQKDQVVSQAAAVLDVTSENVQGTNTEPMEEIILSQIQEMNEMDDITEGFWSIDDNVADNKRGRSSAEEDSDTTVKATFGSFVTSIISTGSQFRKRLKQSKSENQEEKT